MKSLVSSALLSCCFIITYRNCLIWYKTNNRESAGGYLHNSLPVMFKKRRPCNTGYTRGIQAEKLSSIQPGAPKTSKTPTTSKLENKDLPYFCIFCWGEFFQCTIIGTEIKSSSLLFTLSLFLSLSPPPQTQNKIVFYWGEGRTRGWKTDNYTTHTLTLV